MKETLLKLLLGQLWVYIKPLLIDLLDRASDELIKLIEKWVAEANLRYGTGEEKRAFVLEKMAAEPKFSGLSKSARSRILESVVAKVKGL